MQLKFLGANRQVTGSRYFLEAGGLRIMIDCGLFQERPFLKRNWQQPPIDPKHIDCLLLTHAHLDHCGLIPRLVKAGFNSPIYTTEPSVDLAEIIMIDSGRIQAEDAKYKLKRHKREKRKGPRPVVPLYTAEDAEKAAQLLEGVGYEQPLALNDQVSVTFHDAGHILGSSILELNISEDGLNRRILFSGDIGQWDKPLIGDPTLMPNADYVVLESTYGDRNHKDCGDIQDQIADIVNDTYQRGGSVVIPTFAVERAQELTYHLGRLVHTNRIPDLPIYLDSPMAVDVTDVFRRSRGYLDEQTHQLFESGEPPLRYPGLHLVRSVDESKAINAATGPNIIMASSGMCTGGRIKHHLRRCIVRSDSTIVFVGYQSPGTLGRLILDGRPSVRIHGRPHDVRAKIAQIHGFSAHGDRDDLLRWLGHLERMPRHVFLTHGEEKAACKFESMITEQLGWSASVPHFNDTIVLD